LAWRLLRAVIRSGSGYICVNGGGGENGIGYGRKKVMVIQMRMGCNLNKDNLQGCCYVDDKKAKTIPNRL